MRFRRSSPTQRAFVVASLVLLASGCGSNVSRQPFTTAGIPPRPSQGMAYDPPPANMETATLGYRPKYEQPQEPPSYLRTGSIAPQRPAAPRRPVARHRNGDPGTTASIRRARIRSPQQARWHTIPRTRSGSIPQAAIPADSQVIKVREGDTLYGLSQRYRVSVAELVSVNKISGGRIDVGQKLYVPADVR
jgi:LysM domain